MDVNIQVRGSCGKIHSTFKEWQDCKACSYLDGNNAGYQLSVEVWNAAIEAAAKVCDKYDSYGAAYEIRKVLKK